MQHSFDNKLSLAFILNEGERQQDTPPDRNLPLTSPDVEEEEEPVHTLVALKNYIVQQHQLQLLQHQEQHQQQQQQDLQILHHLQHQQGTITTTRSSFYFVNTGEDHPLVLPKFRPQETSDDYLFFHHQQHQQQLLPLQHSILPPLGYPEAFSTSGRKRKLPEISNLASSTPEDSLTASTSTNKKPKHKQTSNGGNRNKKEKKRRVRPTREQATFLDRYFQSNPHPDTPARLKIAQSLNMSPKTVCTWFQNKRAREKRALKKQKKTAMVFHDCQGMQHDDALLKSAQNC